MEKENLSNEAATNPPVAEKLEGDETTVKNIDEEESAKEIQGLTISKDLQKLEKNADLDGKMDDDKAMKAKSDEDNLDKKLDNDESNKMTETEDLSIAGSVEKQDNNVEYIDKMHSNEDSDCKAVHVKTGTAEEVIVDEEAEPVFDGTEIPDVDVNENVSVQSSDFDHEVAGSAWPEKAVALKNFVKERGSVAVTTFMRRLSGKGDQIGHHISAGATVAGEASPKTEKSAWNPLNYIKVSRDVSAENSIAVGESTSREAILPIITKGNVILYSRLGCHDCKEIRSFLREKRLRYVEINIDLYPSRESELEKFSGSSAVPKVFFNEILIGGLEELKGLDKSGKLKDKIEYLISEVPSLEAPMCPLSAEDDESNDGPVDEFALIVNKMKESIVLKDRFYKMRRFTNCFLGSEAVDFLSEDQYLEREEAIEFGRKLASKLFYRHVLDENLFEDGNHLYRFLDHDPIVSAHCHNIPKGITELKPKPIKDIVSRLRLLCSVVFEIYTSVDGKHVDYRSIHGSEEFARYLRLVQELQRVELQDLTKDEKLAFFINLYNLMAIHGILECGPPTGPLDRRKLFGDFKYVIGGCTYSLSAIQNGILRANRRPPYNLMKPFGARDKRLSVALLDAEPLVHFALVSGTRYEPALRCYSAENINKELIEAAQQFFRDGGLLVDSTAKVAYVSKILKWFSIDFGKNEEEVLKHAATYLDPTQSEELLELLTSKDLKVIYQPYDWGLNC